MKKLTNKEAIAVIETEKKCVARANICDRDCAHCDLVLPEEDILLAYDMAIRALSHHVVPFGKVTSLDEEDDRK